MEVMVWDTSVPFSSRIFILRMIRIIGNARLQLFCQKPGEERKLESSIDNGRLGEYGRRVEKGEANCLASIFG